MYFLQTMVRVVAWRRYKYCFPQQYFFVNISNEYNTRARKALDKVNLPVILSFEIEHFCLGYV